VLFSGEINPSLSAYSLLYISKRKFIAVDALLPSLREGKSASTAIKILARSGVRERKTTL
jgi:hypothetical protein